MIAFEWFCTRGFKKSSHLKQHVRSHTGEKPYQCVQCHRKFVSGGVLKAHMRTHTGVKAYKCLICDTTFTTNGSLKRHMSTHSDVRPFMCPYCQKTFKTSVNCKKHMKTHRQEIAIQNMQNSTGSAHAPATDQNAVSDNEDGDIENDGAEEEENDEQDLNILQSNQDLAQQISDTLGNNLEQQLQQTLNQQIFANQTMNQNILGNRITFSQGQFTVQNAPQIDINTLTTDLGGGQTTVNTSLQSTNMQNILQTRDIAQHQQQQQQQQQQPLPTLDEQYSVSFDEDGIKNFKCGYCDKVFKKSSHLKQHIRSHTGEKPYTCDICDKTFISVSVLKNHLKTHSGSKDFVCTLCDATFTTHGSLTRHMLSHSTEQSYKCPVCSESFRTPVLVKRHMKTHRGTAQELSAEYNENKVNKSDDIDFSVEKTVRKVLKVSDDQVSNLHQNNLTVSESILLQSAQEREKVVLPKEKNISNAPPGTVHPHACHACPKSFKKPSDLVRHLRIHTGEKPYKCDLCNRSFTVKSTLDCHMKTHRNSGTLKTIKCHVCNTFYATKGSLKVHMRLHTGAKPFKCPHCDARFRTSGHRKNHVAAHFKVDMPKKKKLIMLNMKENQDIQNFSSDENRSFSLENSLLQQQNQAALQQQQQQATNEQQQQAGMLPISLSIDGLGNMSDPGLAAHILQGLDGIQLQLTGTLGQNVQITGLDPSMVTQTVQIDANLVHQLQQQGINLTLNPNVISAPPQVQEQMVQQQVVLPQSSMSTALPNRPHEVSQEIKQSDFTVTPGTSSNLNTSVSNLNTSVSTEMNTIIQAAEIGTAFEVTPSGDIVQKQIEKDTSQQVLQMNAPTVQSLIGNQDNTDKDGNNICYEIEYEPKSNDQRNHVCVICEKGFKRAGHLKDHMYTHGASGAGDQKPLPHKCGVCAKAFAKPSQVERHLRIHTGERPYHCNVCSKAFNQKNALQVHLKKHTGDRPFKCQYCDLSFTQRGNLKTHIKRAHHTDMVESMNITEDQILIAVSSANEVPTSADVPEESLDLENVVDFFQ